MKLPIVLVLACALGAGAAGAETLEGIRKVYLLSMRGGLDQHLADQLARQGPFAVVVDPKQADAVWTDRVDASLIASLEEIRPAAKEKASQKQDGSIESESANKPSVRSSWGGRTRGTVFVVGVGSRQVLWSTYLPLDDTSPKALHRAAQDIVKQLKKDLKPQE